MLTTDRENILAEREEKKNAPIDKDAPPGNRVPAGKWVTAGKDALSSTASLGYETSSIGTSSIGGSSSKSFNADVTTIAKQLFRKVKFMTEDHMNFGSNVCRFVLEKIVCNIPVGVTQVDYWMSIRKPLKKKIDQKRNAKTSEIKHKFMGTSSGLYI